MKLIYFLSVLFISLYVNAGVVTSKNRLIFDEGDIEKNLIIANANRHKIILQTWVDNGEGDPNVNNIPYFVNPSINKMDSLEKVNLKVIRNFSSYNDDKESVHWLNLYEIPSIKRHDTDLSVSLAMNTQIKIFFRPKILKKINIDELSTKLSFYIENQDDNYYIVCHNKSKYHASLDDLKLSDKNITIKPEMDMMVKPLSYKKFILDVPFKNNSSIYIDFSLIDDDGVRKPFRQNVNNYHLK